MTESVAVAKDADAKKGVSPTKSDNSIPRLRDEPEMQLGSLRDVIGNIRRDGGTPSAESIATELSGMSMRGRAPALMALQQTHGNRYVQRVVAGIQAKLKIGQPGDIYEQEADRVADAVMRMPEPQVQPKPTHPLSQGPSCGDEDMEGELIQSSPISEKITPIVQRKKEPQEQAQEIIPEQDSRIQSLRGGGTLLPESTRAFFEPRFGHDFSNVRVHTGVNATKIAESIYARAFTIGNNIVFGHGQYSAGTDKGRRLLGHELAHVIQQDKSGFVSGNFRGPICEVSKMRTESIQRDIEPVPTRPTPPGSTPTPTPTPAPTPTPGQEALGSLAEGLETFGGFTSARWLWNPINEQIAEWEGELDRAGEQEAPDTFSQVVLIPIAVLFTILQVIVGTLDLIARLNLLNVELQRQATQIRVLSGQYSRDDLIRGATELGYDALDIITLGIRGAIDHLQEGIEEGNPFQITRAVTEFALAALALFGIGRTIRAWRRARGAGTASAPAEAAAPAEPAVSPTAPTEPAAPRGPARPRGRSSEPVRGRLRVEREFRTEEAARQIRNEYVGGETYRGWEAAFSEESMIAHWRGVGGTGRPPLAFVDTRGSLVFDARRLGLAPERLLAEGTRRRLARRPPPPPQETALRRASTPINIQAEILNAEFARDLVRCWRQAGDPVLLRNTAQLRQLWERAGRRGDPPIGWVNSEGGLIVNREVLAGH